MIYVGAGYIGLRGVWLVWDKLVAEHREEEIAKESRKMLNGWFMLRCVTLG